MVKSFAAPLARDPEALVAAAREQARAAGALFEGDAAAGRFAARGVEGTYEVAGGQVRVTVTRMPAFAPWSLVEGELRKFFS
ncbi:MAG: hypothetical protein AB1916_11850 [Thermodesulfobacteriota bacterium]